MANTTNRTTRIKHVFGNVLKLAIPLTLRTVTLEGGIVEVTDTDYTPSNHYPVVVQFVNGPLKYELNATIRDNYIAVVEDKGTIPVGNYAIVVLCKDDNGDPRRFKQRCVLEVVDVTADAGIEVGIEFEAQEWLLDGAIFLAIKGEDGIDGVGIESITTDETSVSGEYNQVTFHLTNGSSYTLNVRNGESTEQTLPTNVVVDENYVHTDNNYTDTDKQKIESVDKLFADAEYDRISRRLNFFKHGDTMHTNPLKSIDITDFIRDSRVSSFRIVDGNLTIKLNSDGNNEEFKVPITSINANYYTKSQVDSLYSSLSSRVTPVEVIFTESNDSITSNRTINGIYTDYTNKKPIIGKYGSSVGVLLYISSQEAAFLFGDRYDKPFILRNSGSTHWGKEDLVDDSSSIVIDDAPTPESDNAVSSGSVWYYLTQRIQSVTINGTTKTPDDNGNVNFTVQGGGGYTPPQGGIPKTDLASGVQSSLDAADSAYQKPNGGIPASDLSSAVQTSLGKADTALQSSDLEGYATTDDVDDAVATLVSSAPQTLDTLKELADALGDDPNFATTMATQLGNKVDKETGKGLSTNDYTTAEKTKLAGLENYDDSALQTAIDGKVDKESGKSLMTDAEHTKLAGIAAGAEVNVNADWNASSGDAQILNKPTIPSKTSDLTNDSGFIDKAMYYGESTTAAATMPKVCTVETFPTYTSNGVTHAKEGTIIAVKFTNSDTNTTDAPKLNVNGIGAKAIMYNNAIVTSTAKNTTVAGTAKMLAYYRYDPELDEGNGAWEFLAKSVDSNSTYSNASLGQGYATQSNSAAATAITASISSYALSAGGIVTIKFTYDVPANATLNINSKGAKAIYNQGAAIKVGVIKAGDTATFIYSTYYYLLSVDSWQDKQDAISDLATIRSGAAAGATAAQPDDIPTKVSDLDNDSGFTSNAGTITGITMNGTSKGTSGVVDLGTVITAHQDISGKANTADLATVATSGSYNDLSNKPTIPDTSTLATKTELNTKQDKINDLASIRINSGKGVADMSSNEDGTVVCTLANGDAYTIDLNHEHPQYVESDDLADVATTGSYDDLTDKPTIPQNIISGVTFNGTSATITNGVAAITATIPDVSGKANASEMSVSTNNDQTTITLKTGTSATVINQHQSLSGYAKYVLLADDAAYEALTTKDSGTLYLIPES